MKYTRCTKVEKNDFWCATKVENEILVDAEKTDVNGLKSWGYCNNNCPKEGGMYVIIERMDAFLEYTMYDKFSY